MFFYHQKFCTKNRNLPIRLKNIHQRFYQNLFLPILKLFNDFYTFPKIFYLKTLNNLKNIFFWTLKNQNVILKFLSKVLLFIGKFLKLLSHQNERYLVEYFKNLLSSCKAFDRLLQMESMVLEIKQILVKRKSLCLTRKPSTVNLLWMHFNNQKNL